jgi:hypothetical protein
MKKTHIYKLAYECTIKVLFFQGKKRREFCAVGIRGMWKDGREVLSKKKFYRL